MTDTTMTTVHLEATGAPDVLVAAQLPLPTPGSTQVLVKTRAVGVNFIETYQRAGVYPVPLHSFPVLRLPVRWWRWVLMSLISRLVIG